MIEPNRAKFAKAKIWIHSHCEDNTKPVQVDIFEWYGDVYLLKVTQKECNDNNIMEAIKGLPLESDLNVDIVFDYENGMTGESLERQYYVRFVNLA